MQNTAKTAARKGETQVTAHAFDILVEAVVARVLEALESKPVVAPVDTLVDEREFGARGRRRRLNALRAGELPGVKHGQSWMVRPSDHERWIQTSAARKTPKAGPVTERDSVAAALGLRRVR